MKKTTLILFMSLLGVHPAMGDLFQGITFGSTTGEEILRDNFGNPLLIDGTPDTTSFNFQIGAFADGFAPTSQNTSQWITYWRVFDVLDFSTPPDLIEKPGGEDPGSMAINLDTGTTASLHPDANTSYVFAGQEAWLWVYNGDDIYVPGTEWFLGRVGGIPGEGDPWVFPMFDPDTGDCLNCPGVANVQWAMNQFRVESTIPIWGGQTGKHGAGEFAFTDEDFTLQTFVIPEPGALVLAGLALLASVLVGFRRKGERS